MAMLLMETEYIRREADVQENIHFHIGLVELKGPVRHLGKDT